MKYKKIKQKKNLNQISHDCIFIHKPMYVQDSPYQDRSVVESTPFIIYLFRQNWGLNLEPSTNKLYPQCFLLKDLAKLPRLISNLQPSCFSLLGSWHYRCTSTCLTSPAYLRSPCMEWITQGQQQRMVSLCNFLTKYCKFQDLLSFKMHCTWKVSLRHNLNPSP